VNFSFLILSNIFSLLVPYEFSFFLTSEVRFVANELKQFPSLIEMQSPTLRNMRKNQKKEREGTIQVGEELHHGESMRVGKAGGEREDDVKNHSAAVVDVWHDGSGPKHFIRN
jgi:hypothetical protein